MHEENKSVLTCRSPRRVYDCPCSFSCTSRDENRNLCNDGTKDKSGSSQMYLYIFTISVTQGAKDMTEKACGSRSLHVVHHPALENAPVSGTFVHVPPIKCHMLQRSPRL